MGDALTELSGVRVYRDGNLIHTADGTVAETAQTYTDNTISEPGYYTYRVQGYNTAGDGVYKEARIFVGKDKPGKVRNIALATNGNTATLSWNSPEKGLNDGWYDKASLRYKVVRQPDGKVVSEATADSTVTDNVSKYAGYYYQVIPSNAQGTGDTVSSKRRAVRSISGNSLHRLAEHEVGIQRMEDHRRQQRRHDMVLR